MTAFSRPTSLSQHGKSIEETVNKLQHDIQQTTHKLEETRHKTRQAQQEIIQCEAERRRRMDLTMGKDAVVPALMELGEVLQEEKQLSKQLNGQASADRKQRNDLQERLEGITNKVRSLTAEIQEREEHLAEAKARNMAAQSLIQAPTGKSKRNQSKPK